MEWLCGWGVVINLLCAFACAVMAERKGLGTGWAFLAGLIFGIVGLFVVGLWPPTIRAEAERAAAIETAMEQQRGAPFMGVLPLQGDAATLRAALAEAELREAAEMRERERVAALERDLAAARATLEHEREVHRRLAAEWDQEKERLTAQRDAETARADRAERYAKSLEALEMERDALAGALGGQAAARVRCRGCGTIFRAERGSGVYDCPGCRRKVRVEGNRERETGNRGA